MSSPVWSIGTTTDGLRCAQKKYLSDDLIQDNIDSRWRWVGGRGVAGVGFGNGFHLEKQSEKLSLLFVL